MNETQQPLFQDDTLIQLARAYPYPPTPDIAQSVRQQLTDVPTTATNHPRRTPSWAVALAAVIALLVLGMLAVPQTRAAVRSLIARIGAIQLFVDDASPTATPTTASQGVLPAAPTPVPLALLAAAPGEPIALGALNEFAAFPVRLPDVKEPWGEPDSAVVHQVANHSLLTLIWDDPRQPGHPYLTFSQTDIPQLAFKMVSADQVTWLQVQGHDGVWIQGPHTTGLLFDGTATDEQIASNVLLWSDDAMTYRIEGDIAMEDAIRLAESLTTVSPDP
ncbi:MAG: hypothetical protein R3C44_17685 [Chloroflexota bacterium]